MKTMLALMLLVQAGAVPVYSGDRRDEPPQAPRSADVQVLLVRAAEPQAP